MDRGALQATVRRAAESQTGLSNLAQPYVLWPPDVKSRLIGKDPDAGKDRRQKKRVAKDEIVA